MNRRSISFLVATVLAVSLAGSASAGRKSSMVFFGSGYGHGIGMSQYGAMGLAKQGWSAQDLLRHYYTGVKVVKRPPPAEAIRVGLLQGTGSVRVAAAAGGFDLVTQGGELVESVPEGTRRTIEVTSSKEFRVLRPDGSAVGDRAWGGPGNPLLATVNGRIRVVEWGHEISHGHLRFEVAAAGKAHVVAAMTVEDYLLGLAEVPNSWPAQALGAQAIAARTYAYWRIAGPERPGCLCDVYSTTADQNYTGHDKEAEQGANRWAAAVADTARTVIVYGDAYIYAVYSSSSGGHTEDIERVWPGAQPLAYLRGVCDPGASASTDPSLFWSATYAPADLTNRLKPYTGDIGQVTGFDEFQLGVSGRVTYLRVLGTTGSKVIEGWDVRSGLSLKDTRFMVNRNLNISGAIRGTYDRLRCAPGRAVTQQKKVKGGRWQGFAVGRMYENGKRNAVTWLRGAVLREYLQAGGPRSRLRLPYRAGKRKAWFEGGTISCVGGCKVRYARAR